MNNSSLDRISGVFFTLLGALVFAGAWAMPRFEAQGAPIYQAPGFTPALLGIGLSICGLFLVFRPAGKAAEDFGFWSDVLGNSANRKRALAAFALTLGYGAVLFGNMPYVPATFLFIFAFVAVFEIWLKPEDATKKMPIWRVLTIAAVLGLIVSFGTHIIFQKLFLVQLP
ncbi:MULTISPECIES: tripartite tricarboxylate transporter TctB family protein [Falsihalocynthiibacter]|uniref:tripartite tricarboxylate transporter TctB family protein n=1 Tax=Falsihalocynthiibacter TaxID=2854182 RepID=UPI0030012A29